MFNYKEYLIYKISSCSPTNWVHILIIKTEYKKQEEKI